ncbi:Mitochondrial group I intron splicing factor CCM1 [Yarrowia sp. E02]|nr:Mitochondrial group I intron splicing factor CCM1 [Yarrowia sp. E02]
MLRARLLVPLIRPALTRPPTRFYATALGSRFRKTDAVRTELKFDFAETPATDRELVLETVEKPLKEDKSHVRDEDIDSLFDSLMSDHKVQEKTQVEQQQLLSNETEETQNQSVSSQNQAVSSPEDTNPMQYLEKSKLTPHVSRQVAKAMTGCPTFLQLATPASHHISTSAYQTDLWSHVIASLDTSKFKIPDFNSLMTSIPVDIRAQFLPQIEEWISKRGVKPSAITYGQVMLGYAEAGNVEKVEERFRQMVDNNIVPTVHTYAHRLKACDKKGDLKQAMEIFEDLKLAQQLYSIRPNQVIFTTLISTSLRNHKVELASQIFEYMKYASNETQPTAQTYNSLITASAIRSNTERALDLFEEMKTKAVANVRTYQSLIMACLRQEKYHLKAWELLLELREQHSESFYSRHTLVVVFQAAAVTGDLPFLRSLYKQLCMSADTYPDAILTQLLMQAYARYDTRSKSAASSALRATWSRLYKGDAQAMMRGFLFPSIEEMAELNETHPGMIPPFIPTTTIASLSFDRRMIISESRAVFQFLKENKPQLLDDIAAIDYLKAGARHRDFPEFLRRYNEVSVPVAAETDGAIMSPTDRKTYSARQKKPQRYDAQAQFTPAPRSDAHFFVALNAVQADCLADAHELDANLNHSLRQLSPQEVNDRLDFAQDVWVERGKWRKTEAFTQRYKTEAQRISADYNFALKIINALAALKQLGEAASILAATPATFNWKKHDLAFFYTVADAFYHEEAMKQIYKAVSRGKRLEEAIRNPDSEKSPAFDIFSI